MGSSQPYLMEVFALSVPSLTVSPIRVFVWIQHAERSRPLGLSTLLVDMDGQPLLLILRWFLFVCRKMNEKRKAIVSVPGHLKLFWWDTPRIPGISRVFQSYVVWDLGTPRSHEQHIKMTPSPRVRREEKEKPYLGRFFNTLGKHYNKGKQKFHGSPL